MIIEKVFEKLRKKGWEYSLRCSDGIYEFAIWRKSWISSDLYQSTICPSWKGKDLKIVLEPVNAMLCKE